MVLGEVAVEVGGAGESGGREELGYAVCLVCELVLCDFSGVCLQGDIRCGGGISAFSNVF